VFTAAVLLLFIAGLTSWIAYSGATFTIGGFSVPGAMSWGAAGAFALVGVLAMRAAHLAPRPPTA
jgi:hypothetical protein